MQDDKTPKIFISYSWTSDSLVLELAQRLVSHGVDVVLDKWDLKEGQDKYAFMEQCVNNPEITRVLIVCDKAYAEKANNRTGGVGDETVIISSEIYGNVKQEKFIPIIAERDEDGKGFVPTYIKTRIYIDLSNPDIYEAEYEKLLRNIYEKPQFVKPKLGKRPEWLDEEKTNFFPLKDLLRQIRGSGTDKKRKACIVRFQNAYLEALKEYFQKNASPEQTYNTFLASKPIRDIFLDFLSVIAEAEPDYSEVIAGTFEEMYNCLTCVKFFDSGAGSASGDDFDFYRVLIWELFICTAAFMRNLKDYNALNQILTHTYFLIDNVFGGDLKPNNYTAFRYHSRVIEDEYKQKTEFKDKFTLVGNVICTQREYLPIYTAESLAEADLLLYQVCDAYTLAQNESLRYRTYWFPTLYVYARNFPSEWARMKSKKFCEKMFALFGVNSIVELKEAIAKCKPDQSMKYRGSFEPAAALLDCISTDEIGSLP